MISSEKCNNYGAQSLNTCEYYAGNVNLVTAKRDLSERSTMFIQRSYSASFPTSLLASNNEILGNVYFLFILILLFILISSISYRFVLFYFILFM
jgi:uncharacterized membrane protein